MKPAAERLHSNLVLARIALQAALDMIDMAQDLVSAAEDAAGGTYSLTQINAAVTALETVGRARFEIAEALIIVRQQAKDTTPKKEARK